MDDARTLNQNAGKWLKTHLGERVRFDEPMARHTSFRVGGPVEAFATPPTAEALAELIRWAQEEAIPCRIIGGGTNLLVADRGIRGIVVSLKLFREIAIVQRKDEIVWVRAMAGTSLKVFCQYAARNGMDGMQFALGIPGTVGGGIMMNAGASRGSMADVLSGISVMDSSGAIHDLKPKDFRHGYRSFSWDFPAAPGSGPREAGRAVLLAGTFRLELGQRDARILREEAKNRLMDRMAKQPVGMPSAGCFFKNPRNGSGAGELIDRAGLKGSRVGDAEVSPKHANFIVNRGRASGADILALAGKVRETVHQKFGVCLEPEVRVLE